MRYADYLLDVKHNRIICIREDHTDKKNVINSIVSLNASNIDNGEVLVSGNDFYSSPRLDKDCSHLAWLTWNHPNQPWDGTELWVGELGDEGAINNAKHMAGSATESIFQPEWAPNGSLYFVSDRTGWWNIYRWNAGEVELLCEMEAEFGGQQRTLGMSMYGFKSENELVCVYNNGGYSHLAILDVDKKTLKNVELPYTAIDDVRVNANTAVFIGTSSMAPTSIVSLNLNNGEFAALRRSTDIHIDAKYISIPEAIEFPSDNGATLHAFFYPQRNADYAFPNEAPPLIVVSHAGPTGISKPVLSFETQYWTSRGFAVLDVNYSGSTGYGREYRERLKGMWGVMDVDDCVNGAKYLAELGRINAEHAIIRGSCAGGYTALCALIFRNFFKAGASYYGWSDLDALVKDDLNKFEVGYADKLIGPYPQRRDIYLERSPITSVGHLSCPVIFFQGSEDKIVLPSRTEKLFKAIRDNGVSTAYLLFKGEGHGFRKAESIKRAIEAELYFYSKVFGFKPADDIEPVRIENLKELKRK
jgi:dipeptidyl aminopeptidase/acylaminoacyl peptidase